jgi:hypothetical protein
MTNPVLLDKPLEEPTVTDYDLATASKPRPERIQKNRDCVGGASETLSRHALRRQLMANHKLSGNPAGCRGTLGCVLHHGGTQRALRAPRLAHSRIVVSWPIFPLRCLPIAYP